MKPRFALNLAQDGISLLHRMADGWAEVGNARFDDPDLDARIAELRTLAAELEPEGFTTKLIIPESQILYSEVDAPGPDRASRRAQIVAALDGRTPYAVDDLVFDWSRNGRDVCVAVVAKLTLDEAEEFAETHGMNPVSFVAIPAPGQFAGEPFFGQTRTAEQHLPPGERLARDQDPVRIVAAPTPVPAEAPSAETPTPVAPARLPDGPGKAAEMPADRAQDAPGIPECEPVEIELSELNTASKSGVDQESSNIAVPTPDLPAEPAAVTAAAASGLGPDAEDEIAASGPIPSGTSEGAASDAAEAPFIALDDIPDLDAEADGAAEPAPTFSSRRMGDPPPSEPAEGRAESRIHLLADPITAVAALPRLGPAVEVEEAGITAPVLQIPTGPQHEDEAASGGARRPRSGLGRALMNALPEAKHGTQAQQRARRPVPVAEAPTEPGVFGATRATRAAATSRRRLGLILAAIVVLLALATALWWAWFSAAPEPSAEVPAEAPALAQTPAPLGVPARDGSDVAAAAPGAETAPGEVQTATAALPVATPDAAPSAPEAAPPPAPLPDPVETAKAEPQADPGPAAPDPTTLWDAAPATATIPEADAPGAPVVAAAAPIPAAPVAEITPLPSPDADTADTRPAPQPLPPPFGTEIEFGPDGLILATPDGVVTPGGFTLISGKPPVVPAPAPRPESTPDAPADQSGDATGTVTPAPGTEPDAADGAVAEAMAAPAPVNPAHAALKPRARPAAIVQRAEAARAQAAAIAAAAEAAARAEAEALASASSQAVASSRRPAARPAGLSKAVEAAVAAAVNEAVTSAVAEAASQATAVAPAPEPAPSAAPEEIDEPEPTKPAPNIPTSVTVSKQATVKNAIDLGDINLIGVFGSSANRRALVRMPTGRLIKVKVGDRLDGGKVAAIGDSELIYVKNGRNYTLKIVDKG